MSILEEIIGDIFLDVIWRGIKGIGALVRWPFLPKYRFDELFKQTWSGIIGLAFIPTQSF